MRQARSNAAILGRQRRKIRTRRHSAAGKLGAWRRDRRAGDPEAETFEAIGGRVKKSKGDLPKVSAVADDLPFGLPATAIGEIAEQTAFVVRENVDQVGPRAFKAYRFQWTIWKLSSRYGSSDEADQDEQPEWDDNPRTVSSSYRSWEAFGSTIRDHVIRSVTPRDTDESRRVWVVRLAVYAIPFHRGSRWHSSATG